MYTNFQTNLMSILLSRDIHAVNGQSQQILQVTYAYNMA